MQLSKELSKPNLNLTDALESIDTLEIELEHAIERGQYEKAYKLQQERDALISAVN